MAEEFQPGSPARAVRINLHKPSPALYSRLRRVIDSSQGDGQDVEVKRRDQRQIGEAAAILTVDQLVQLSEEERATGRQTYRSLAA